MKTPLVWPSRAARLWAMSMVALFTLMWGAALTAHETAPAIANVDVGPDGVAVEIAVNAEALLAGVDLGTYSDTNNAPEAEAYDALRALAPEDLRAAIAEAGPDLLSLRLEGAGALTLAGIAVVAPGSEALARETVLTLTAPLEAGAEAVSLGWPAENGVLVIRQARDGQTFAELVDGGGMSAPLPIAGVVEESAGEAFWRFLVAGFEHIVPLGADHILFVLGLFFFALKWGPILWQVTAFTVAHSVTLALATFGVVTIPDAWMWLVEAFIALSITWVAVENILQPRLGWLRPAVVFAFGLLHGLGFASVLSDFGLSQGQFVVSLIAFNVGVELGQLAVILAAFLVIMLGLWAARLGRLDDPEEAMVRDLPEMYRANAIVGSLLIGAIGFYWFIERAFL
ncbi:MAG: HupE/UreJ family protein [Pseudomonadota bacterium]